MPAGSWKVYGAALESIIKNDLDLDATFRMVLLTSSYTPNQSTHSTFADMSAAQVANGNGYATHGKAASVTVARSGLVVTIDAADQTWTASSITAKYAAIVQDANNDGAIASTDKLLAFVDLETSGGSLSSSNADFTVQIDAAGVFTATAS